MSSVMAIVDQWLDPGRDLALPGAVRACATTRIGGVSEQRHASLDLGGERDGTGRLAAAVLQNRETLRAALGLEQICFLDQVHGCTVHRVGPDDGVGCCREPAADATVVERAGVAACVLTADCLPVLFAHADGHVVAAAHAGWRGLAAGVLEATLTAMRVPPGEVSAWLGPAIGAAAFEVGADVRDAFLAADQDGNGPAELAATPGAFRRGQGDRWHADLWVLARYRLQRAGVTRFGGGGIDVHGRPEQFYSWRRDGGHTGRQATLIWISPRHPRS